ncbi:hypothetical protein EV360DRAFT_89155 [Lentinula raphanica]|nr:hypothetical protein EV360DRAFT_89155 [Lentinula raphanica]
MKKAKNATDDNVSSESEKSLEDSALDDNDDDDDLTPEQHREVKILRELDKHYKNTTNNSYTYHDPVSGSPVRLSNVAVEIWMAKTATLDQPPANNILFKPVPHLAHETFGISHATLHRYALESARYGPDILDVVNDSALTAIGLSPGDAIQLKREAPIWWNGPLAKCKLTLADQAETPPELSKKRRVQLEKHWKDGSGAAQYMGSIGESDDIDDNDECDWFYFSNATESFLPIPHGYAAILNEDNDYQNSL